MDALKNRRTAALRTFTRNEKTLIKWIDDASPKHLVTPQYEKVQACWNKLEEIQDDYIAGFEGDITEEDSNKLDEPNERYLAAMKKYSDFIKVADDVERTDLQQKEKETRDTEEAIRKQLATEKKTEEDEQQKVETAAKFLSSKEELETGIDAFN